MKKFALTLLIAAAILLAASSCNRQICPAYTKADVPAAEFRG